MKKIQLSKSKLKELAVCERQFYFSVYRPKDKVWDQQTLKVFDQGREVEAIARNIYPDGKLQDKIDNYEKTQYTKELLKTSNVIFEAAFATRNTIVQFDILKKVDEINYHATEIKSSGKMKPEYYDDALIQYWVATKTGLSISRFELWFVNKDATQFEGSEYFAKEDVTEFVKSNERKFWEKLNKAEELIELNEAPNPQYSTACEECPFAHLCNFNREDTSSVLNLPRFVNKYKAFNQGIKTIHDQAFKEKYKFYEQNPTIIESIKENKLVFDSEAIKNELSKYVFPLNFFDFEAVMGAIPMLENQKPFEQLVIQYSLHIYSNNDKMDHFYFLHESKKNPNQSLIESMLNHLEQNNGSIVSYNQNYEKTRIKELAVKFPEFAPRLLKLLDRFVDLLDVIKDYTYHPEYRGSYSLKVVSPIFLKEYGSYSDSTIKSGSEISSYYKEMIETTNLDRKKEIKEALLRYCGYDTLNLFLIYKYLLDQSVDVKRLVELNLGGSNG